MAVIPDGATTGPVGRNPARVAGSASLAHQGGARNGARSVERALSILTAFTIERPELRLQELSRAIAVPKSTTHRLLQALVRHGLVERGRLAGSYRLTVRTAALGAVALWGRRPAEDVHSVLRSLRDETGETVGLSVLEGRDAIVVERVHSWHQLAANVRVGSVLPGHATAAGKLLLSELPPEAFDPLFDAFGPLAPYTPRTICSVSELKRQLAVVRDRGFSIDNCEFAEGLRCAAVPVRDMTGACVYALGISASATRISVQDLTSLVPRLIAGAKTLTLIVSFVRSDRD